MSWTAVSGWQGIGEELLAEWQAAYPACDLPRQLAAMTAWLKANPVRARKSNWKRSVTNWLSKEQDRGGDAKNHNTNQTPRRGQICSSHATSTTSIPDEW